MFSENSVNNTLLLGLCKIVKWKAVRLNFNLETIGQSEKYFTNHFYGDSQRRNTILLNACLFKGFERLRKLMFVDALLFIYVSPPFG